MAVYKVWFDFFCSKTLDKIKMPLSEKLLKDLSIILSKRIFIVSFSVIKKYISDYIEQQNPFYLVDPEIVFEKDKERYIKEVAEILRKAGPDALSEYSLLMNRIDIRCNLFASFVNEMISRIELHRNEISEKLLKGKVFNEITGFASDGADVHNGGKSSFIINTDTGKFLYKPHDCRMDLIFKDICTDYFSDVIKVPELLYICEDYSFIEFIENKPADTEEDAAKYYSNLGGFCCLLTFLNGNDFHEENILADGIFPVPIDFETVFMSGFLSVYKPTAEEDMNRSAFRTSMFSVKSVKISAREVSPLFDLTDFNVSAPVVNGKRLSAVKFKESFKNGFADVYRRCLLLKNELFSAVSEVPDLKIRILLRNTNYYSLFWDEMNSWKYLKNNDKNKDFLVKLMKDLPEEIALAELNSMSNGDIPYFYEHPFSKDIFSGDKLLVKDYYPISPVEYLKESLALRNERELVFELGVIDKLFDNTITEENSAEKYIFNSLNPLQRAGEIFRRVMDSFDESPSNNLFIIQTRNECYPGILEIDFANGKTGIALFCSALFALSDDLELKKECFELCERLIGEIVMEINVLLDNRQYLKKMNDDFGIVWAVELISKYIGRHFDENPAFEKLRGFKEKKFKNRFAFDSETVFKDCLSGGNAGIADMLIEKYKETSDVGFLDKAKEILLSKSYYNFISDGYPSLFCSDFMGGAAGVGYELLRIVNPFLIESVFKV